MRVYVPATLRAVADLVAGGSLLPGEAFAVTPGLLAWVDDDDDDAEAQEFAALQEAARASLRLLAAHPDLPARRVVLAADVVAVVVEDSGTRGPGSVEPAQSLAIDQVISAHVDEPSAERTVRAAADAVAAADAGDADAEATVSAAADLDLLWYAVQELPDLH